MRLRLGRRLVNLLPKLAQRTKTFTSSSGSGCSTGGRGITGDHS